MDPQRLVATWLDGRAKVGEGGSLVLGPRRSAGLSEKLRRAYAWITQQALVVPYLDLELGDAVNAWGLRADEPRYAPKPPRREGAREPLISA